MSRAATWTGVLLVTVPIVLLIAWRVDQALGRRDAAAERTTASGPVPVQIAAIERRDLSGVVELSGTIRPANQVDIAADVPGRVVAVLVSVGHRVARGDVLARLDATDLSLALSQAEGALAAAAANVELATQEANSAEKLASSAAITENQRVAAKTRRMAAEGQLKQAQAARDLARERVRDATITSPIAGVVTRESVDVGQSVSPAAPIFQVQDDSAYEVEVGLDEATAYTVHPGQAVEVVSTVRPDHVVPGTIATVAPTLDPQTRKAAAVVRLEPSTSTLLAYSTVSVRIAQASRPGVIVAPASAIVDHHGSPAVRVVGEGNLVRVVPVRTGTRQGDLIEVSGVTVGDRVIVAGPVDLTDGAVVDPRS